MSVLMQGKLFRAPLVRFVKPPLGFLGYRMVTNDTKFPKCEQSERVDQILRKFIDSEKPLQQSSLSPNEMPNQSYVSLKQPENQWTSRLDSNLYKPSRRSANSARFTYEPPTLAELGQNPPTDQWDEFLYD